MSSATPRVVDVDEVIERGRLRGLLLFVMGCLFLTLLFDGLDFTMIGYLMPVISKDFGATREEVTWILALSPIGGALGGFIGGFFGDRVGRRRTLIASVTLFSLAGFGIAAAPTIPILAALRFVGAIGLGAATPSTAALLSEVLPKRWRAQILSAVFIGFPLGAALNGVLIPIVVPEFGWRGLVVLGAVLPLLMIAPLTRWAPESPGFLAIRETRRRELASLLSKLDPTDRYTADDQFTLTRPPVMHVGMRALLSPTYVKDTLCLWIVAFSNQFAAVSLSSWATTALTAVGFAYFAAVNGMMAGNLAGAAGALVGGWAMGRFGSRKSLRFFALIGAAIALAAFWWTSTVLGGAASTAENVILIVAMAFVGISISGVQLGDYPLATNVYPVTFRASGVGNMVAIGRLGAISAVSVTGFFVNNYGPQFLFVSVGAAITVTLVALSFIGRHTEPVPRA
jgi:AAHS family 4-hydroxybenzoate transporter-like MFS transporter